MNKLVARKHINQRTQDAPHSVGTPRPAFVCAYPRCGRSFEETHLGGDAQRYCSSKCRRCDWERRHPRVLVP